MPESCATWLYRLNIPPAGSIRYLECSDDTWQNIEDYLLSSTGVSDPQRSDKHINFTNAFARLQSILMTSDLDDTFEDVTLEIALNERTFRDIPLYKWWAPGLSEAQNADIRSLIAVQRRLADNNIHVPSPYVEARCTPKLQITAHKRLEYIFADFAIELLMRPSSEFFEVTAFHLGSVHDYQRTLQMETRAYPLPSTWKGIDYTRAYIEMAVVFYCREMSLVSALNDEMSGEISTMYLRERNPWWRQPKLLEIATMAGEFDRQSGVPPWVSS
jgi:hypothetical protein